MENACERLANTCEYLQMLENEIQTLRLSCKCLANSQRFQCTFDSGGVARVAKMVQNAPSSLVLYTFLVQS